MTRHTKLRMLFIMKKYNPLRTLFTMTNKHVNNVIYNDKAQHVKNPVSDDRTHHANGLCFVMINSLLFKLLCVAILTGQLLSGRKHQRRDRSGLFSNYILCYPFISEGCVSAAKWV